MEFTEKQIDNVLKFLKKTIEIEKLSDKELSSEIIYKIWSKMNWGEDEELLLNEYIKRFENKCGIKRNEEGEIIK